MGIQFETLNATWHKPDRVYNINQKWNPQNVYLLMPDLLESEVTKGIRLWESVCFYYYLQKRETSSYRILSKIRNSKPKYA